MTIRDVFVPFLSYPDAPTTDTIDAARALRRRSMQTSVRRCSSSTRIDQPGQAR